MGSSILKGITTALLVTVLTLFAGMLWSFMNLGGLSMSRLLDIGLLASCLIGGYQTAKESGEWLAGGIVGAGYVTVGTLLLTFFLPVQGWGFIQVLAEGTIIGLVAGAVGTGGAKSIGMNAWSGQRSPRAPSYPDYGTNDRVSRESDWYKEEEQKSWEEAPLTNWTETSEQSPEVQWPWDKEKDNLQGWKDEPITKGIKSSEKSSEVQWPWNRGKKELVDSGPRYADEAYLEPMRKSAGAGKASGGRPWWE